MTQTVIVPLDGSRNAEAAIPCAALLAGAFKAELLLLGVRADDETAGLGTDAPYFERIASSLASSNLPIRTMLRSGRVAVAIATASDEPQVLAVVLTTQGVGGEHGHLGSVAERLSRSLAAPALFVPPGFRSEPPLRGPLLLGLDGSPAAESVLEPAVQLARALGAPLTLVRVAPWSLELFATFAGIAPPEADSEIEFGSNSYLAGLVERVEDRVDADYQTLRGHAAAMLIEYAESVDGWLVVASHGHASPHLWSLGSTTDKLLRAATRPVLVLRSHKTRGFAPPADPS